MYLRKMRPRTTCLYSAASMFLRSLSAAFQSCFSMGSSLGVFVDLALGIIYLQFAFSSLQPAMDGGRSWGGVKKCIYQFIFLFTVLALCLSHNVCGYAKFLRNAVKQKFE